MRISKGVLCWIVTNSELKRKSKLNKSRRFNKTNRIFFLKFFVSTQAHKRIHWNISLIFYINDTPAILPDKNLFKTRSLSRPHKRAERNINVKIRHVTCNTKNMGQFGTDNHKFRKASLKCEETLRSVASALWKLI